MIKNKTGLQPVSKPVEQEVGFFKDVWRMVTEWIYFVLLILQK